MCFARLLLPLVLGISLVGCQQYLRTPEDQARIDEEMREDTPSEETEGMMIKDGEDDLNGDDGSYQAYSPDVLMNGRTNVLFFHAPWCPTCKKADASLTAWYAANTYPRSIYKVDYDTETELKGRYGVVYQHTFVLVDGEGKALTVLPGPTDAQIQELLGA